WIAGVQLVTALVQHIRREDQSQSIIHVARCWKQRAPQRVRDEARLAEDGDRLVASDFVALVFHFELSCDRYRASLSLGILVADGESAATAGGVATLGFQLSQRNRRRGSLRVR